MKKREVFTVDEKRLKAIMAHETGADGSPKAAGTGKKAASNVRHPQSLFWVMGACFYKTFL